jgi:hypothetical protein
MDAQNRKDNQNAFAALENQGIKMVAPDAAQLKEWKEKGVVAAQSFSKQGKIDPEVVDKVQSLLTEYRAAQ